MGIKDGQYISFSMLTTRVIEVAIAEINEKTDLVVSYEVEKLGRRPISILFTMRLKKKKLLFATDHKEIGEKLKTFGIQDHQVKKLLKAHTPQYLLANIAVVEEKLKKGETINNVPAYLMKAFEVDFTPKETAYDKLQQQKSEEERLEGEKSKKQKLEMAVQMANFKQEKSARLKSLKDKFTEEEFDDLKAEFEAEIMATEFLSSAYLHK